MYAHPTPWDLFRKLYILSLVWLSKMSCFEMYSVIEYG